MLVIDQQKVNRISSKRFADVLDKELSGKNPTIANANPEVMQCMRNTLANVLRSTEDIQSDETVNRLRKHAEDIANLPPPVLVVEVDTVEPVPAIAAKAAISQTKTLNAVENDVNGKIEDTSATKGANIQRLLQSQKDLSAKDLEMEQRTQAMLVNELSELTSLLKDSTMDINRAVNMQNIQLTSMSGYAAENRDELDRQKKRMKESTTVMSTSIWTNVWLMIWIIVMFCVTYGVIRLLPVPRPYPAVCPNRPYEHGEL